MSPVLTDDLFFILFLREAINRLCEAVPGGRGVWRKKVNRIRVYVSSLAAIYTYLFKRKRHYLSLSGEFYTQKKYELKLLY